MISEVKRPRARAAIMPALGFSGDLPVRFDDDMAQARLRALARILSGRIMPTTRAHIGDVARWHRVGLKALRNLEERGITVSERGSGDVRFYQPDQQVRIEVALALRELGATAKDILAFLEILESDRAEARAFLKRFLDRRLADLQDRVNQVAETLTLLGDGAAF